MTRKTINEINERLKTHSTLQILYPTSNEDVMCRCSKCNQQFEKHRKDLWNKIIGCPVCRNLKIIKGYNDVATTDPWMVKYFVDKEDAYKYPSRSRKKVKVKCPDCGYERSIELNNLHKRGFSCPCNNKGYHRVITGINDAATLVPWILDYLVDKDLAYTHAPGSLTSTEFQCPYCHTIVKRYMHDVSKRGFICPICSDGVSYPNKFGRAFIKQTKAENVEFEYIRDWTGGRYYDIYFEYQGKKYFIELDGELHFKSLYGMTLKEIQDNDKYKNTIAKQHDIIMIRIDCRKSDKDYIRKNIEQSILRDIFDLTTIDWNLCDVFSCSSLMRTVCDDYNKGELLINEIADKYHLSTQTVSRYVKTGISNGLCIFNKDNRTRARRILNKRNCFT
jgi:Zn finger protein HypA/HybF involved in hydrogenase expression